MFDKKWGKWHFCDASLNFTVFDLKNLTSYLDRKCKKLKAGLFVFLYFRTSYGRFCIFSDRYFGNISTKTKNWKRRLSVCGLVDLNHEHRIQTSNPNTWNWAGNGQSTSLAVTWLLAQLVQHTGQERILAWNVYYSLCILGEIDDLPNAVNTPTRPSRLQRNVYENKGKRNENKTYQVRDSIWYIYSNDT